MLRQPELCKAAGGNIDSSGNLKDIAAKKIKEELNITIREDKLTCLGNLAEAPRGQWDINDIGEKVNLTTAIFNQY